MQHTLPITKESILHTHFQKFLIGITVLALLVRLVNITYASLWSDELYSMLSVHPDNSFYEMLLLQRRDQPPLYFVLLRLWVDVFGHTDFSARMLSIIIGSASVFAIGWVNNKIYNFRVGLLSAFLVAFNFTQIEYSLEVRFYGLVFLLVVISMYTYYLCKKNNATWFVHILHGGVCAMIILSHHFGAFVVLVYGLFDVADLIRTKFQFEKLKKKFVAYSFTLLLIVPWFYWSLTSIKTVQNYWLKIIDLGGYLLFNLNYNIVALVLILLVAGFGLFRSGFKQNNMNLVLLFQIVMVTIIPLIFSYVKFPILVSRYSFSLAPALYTLIAIGFIEVLALLKNYKVVAVSIVCILLSADGLYHSFINRTPLLKEPWKEMAAWLKSQSGYQNKAIYTVGFMVNDRVSIDYYLPEKKVTHILWDSSNLRKHDQFFLVETNAHDRIADDFRRSLDSNFSKEEVLFGVKDYGKGGVITIYKPLPVKQVATEIK